MSTVLVTGATGFVGSHLVEALLRSGDHVRGLARSPARAEALGIPGVEWVRGDLDDREALARAVAGVEVIYHVAGIVAARSEAEFLTVNREGTARLLEVARDTGARFVLVSSLAAAGPSEPGRPLTGTEPPRPVTAYGRSKLAAEELVRGGPLPWAIVRPPTVYGPRDREMLRVFQAVARTGLAPVFGEGTQELSLVFGPDLAEAIVTAGRAPGALGGTWYPAHPERHTSAGVVRSIGRAGGRHVHIIRVPEPLGRGILAMTGAAARLAGRATLLNPDKGNEFFQPAWTCDPAPFTAATGWSAAQDLERGAAATWSWYREARWL